MLRSTTSLLIAGLLLAGTSHAQDAAHAASTAPPAPEAQAYDAGTVKFHATSAQTGGRFAVVEVVENAGYMTPPHRHDHMDETFYILEGVLRVTMQGATVDYPAGSFVVIPRGEVHAQGSATDGPVRMVITVMPGGFESFFAGRVELARHAPRGTPGFLDGMMKLLGENAQWIQPASPAGDAPAAPGE